MSRYSNRYSFDEKHVRTPVQNIESEREPVFANPHAVNQMEKKFMPWHVDYTLEKDSKIILEHSKTEEGAPIDVMHDFGSSVSHIYKPRMCGVRFYYPDAIAKSVEEITPVILENAGKLKIDLSDAIIETTIKDGSDGLGDVSEYIEKGDLSLPDKAYRYAFAILRSEVVINGHRYILFEEEFPNSVRCNKALLHALGDENDMSSMAVSLSPIEIERNLLSNSILNVATLKHKLKFVHSMGDEKKVGKTVAFSHLVQILFVMCVMQIV